jgi:glucose-6-phosphate 1-dehydrogenase
MTRDDKNPDTVTDLSAVVEGHATIEAPDVDCLLDRPADPCTIVIIGASGDLTSRKLIPALYTLFTKNGLPEPFNIVGCGRTEMSSDQFREKMGSSISGEGPAPPLWEEFTTRLHYQPVVYDSLDS